MTKNKVCDIYNKNTDMIKLKKLVNINESNGSYFDLYIAKTDTAVGNTNIPKDTVIRSQSGGVWRSMDDKIKVSLEDIENNPDFDVINNPTWPLTIELSKAIDNCPLPEDEVFMRLK